MRTNGIGYYCRYYVHKVRWLELSLLKWQQCQWPEVNTMTTTETISWSKKKKKNGIKSYKNFYTVSYFYNVLFQGVFAMVTLGSLAIVGLAAKEVNKFGDKLLEMERSLNSKASDDVLNVVSSFLSNQIGKVVSQKKKGNELVK